MRPGNILLWNMDAIFGAQRSGKCALAEKAAMDLKYNTRCCLEVANATYPGTRSTSFCSSIIGCLQIFRFSRGYSRYKRDLRLVFVVYIR